MLSNGEPKFCKPISMKNVKDTIIYYNFKEQTYQTSYNIGIDYK